MLLLLPLCWLPHNSSPLTADTYGIGSYSWAAYLGFLCDILSARRIGSLPHSGKYWKQTQVSFSLEFKNTDKTISVQSMRHESVLVAFNGFCPRSYHWFEPLGLCCIALHRCTVVSCPGESQLVCGAWRNAMSFMAPWVFHYAYLLGSAVT